MSLKDLQRKEALENAGVWQPFPEDLGGEGLIAHNENPDFQKKFRRAMALYRKQHKTRAGALEEVDPEALEAMVRDAMVGTVLRAIRNVEGENGKVMESTPENIRKILDTRDGFNFVLAVAKSMQAEVEEEHEEVSGNSVASFVGG